MKRLVMAVAALCAADVLAMPTKAELSKAQPLVTELMAPAMEAYKNAAAKDRLAAAVKVGDVSSEFAGAAETEAAKFLLLKGAVNFYARGEAYDKAADKVVALQEAVKDVPPAVIAEITGKATGKISETKAPRLYAQYRAVKVKVQAAEEAKTLVVKLKKVKSDALQRRYAEALAVSGDWKAAYAEFAKVNDAKMKPIIEAEATGKVKNAEAGEFWWAYTPALADAGDFFKAHAAAFFRKALAAGEITGLKKNIIEQRLATVVAEVKPTSTAKSTVSVGAETPRTVSTEAKVPARSRVADGTCSFVTGEGSPFTVKGTEATLTLNNGAKIDFVQCPPGEFPMIIGEKTIVKARISRPFWISKTPLTGVALSSLHEGVDAEKLKQEKYIIRVAKRIHSIADQLNVMCGPFIPKDYVLRSASVAELQYAFRANDNRIGSLYNLPLLKNSEKKVVFIGKDGTASPKPNAWGLYDFIGFEIVADRMKRGDIKNWEDEVAGKFRELPPLESDVDPFYWNTEDIPTEYMMYRTAWWTSERAQGSVHFVIGPDLVSEWKAKHGKK